LHLFPRWLLMARPTVDIDDPKTLVVTPEQAALYLKMSPWTLRHYRREGRGPRFARIGRYVMYPMKELERWVESMTVEPAFYHAEQVARKPKFPGKRKRQPAA